MRRIVLVLSIVGAIGVLGACVPPPSGPAPWGVEVGDCYTREPISTPQGDIEVSFIYLGPASSAHNVEIFGDPTCTDPPTFEVTSDTIVRAADQAAALVACVNLDPSLTHPPGNFLDMGWYLVSGAGTPGEPIPADTWACAPEPAP